MNTSDEKSSFKVVVSAIIGNGSLFLMKLVAWAFSLSPSLLAEAIHSFADTANQCLLLIGLKHSTASATRDHPWGYGSASYVWNLISAVGIFFVGFGVTTYHGISSLVNLKEYSSDYLWLKVSILVLALLIEGFVFLIAIRATKKLKGSRGWINYITTGDELTTIAVLFEDGIAVLGVVLALLGIVASHFLQTNLPDAITSIVIGCLLGALAVLLALANSRLLLGAAAQPDQENEIREFLEELPEVEQVTNLKTEILGPGLLRLTTEIEFHGELMVSRDQLVKDAERIRSGEEDPLPILVDTASRTVRVVGNQINELERKLQMRFPQLHVVELEVN